MQFLEFLVGKQMYALPVLDVVSIEEMKEISNVPLPAEYGAGMVVIRDEVMQVYDLAKRLCVEDFDQYTDAKYGNMLLVVDHNNKRVAMEITMAKDIIEIDEQDIQAVPQSVMNNGNFIKGLINRNNDLVAVIDHHKMFGQKAEKEFSNKILEKNSVLEAVSAFKEKVSAFEEKVSANQLMMETVNHGEIADFSAQEMLAFS